MLTTSAPEATASSRATPSNDAIDPTVQPPP
jgi:hypothetical protein